MQRRNPCHNLGSAGAGTLPPQLAQLRGSSLDVPSSLSFPVQGPENPRTPEVEQKDTTQAFLSVAPEEGPWGSQALGAGVASPAPCEGGCQPGPLNTVTATCNFFFALPLPSEKEAEFHPDDALGEPWRL